MAGRELGNNPKDSVGAQKDKRVVTAMIASGKLPALKAGERARILGRVLVELAIGGAK